MMINSALADISMVRKAESAFSKSLGAIRLKKATRRKKLQGVLKSVAAGVRIHMGEVLEASDEEASVGSTGTSLAILKS